MAPCAREKSFFTKSTLNGCAQQAQALRATPRALLSAVLADSPPLRCFPALTTTKAVPTDGALTQHSLLPDVRPVARQHLENFLGEARPQPARTLCPGQPHELSWMPAPWLSAAPALLSRSLPPTIARCRRCPRPRAGCTSPSTSCSLQIPLQLNTSATPLGGAVFSPELLPA